MIQKGIIERIEDKYTVRVRIPKYDKVYSDATGTKSEDLAYGIMCTLPGMSITYNVGDVVLVAFENDEISNPVVLGLLYREAESNSVLKINAIDSKIKQINNQLNELNSLSLYTHIKYSNDDGMTFTSIYDPTKVIEKSDDGFYLTLKEELQISNKTKLLYWSIIDNNNIDVSNMVNIITILTGINKKGDTILNTSYSEKLIELPFEASLCEHLYLNYIINISKKEAEDYYICLTSDLETIGDVYGDYLGICISNDKEPSLNTKDYTWTSIINRNELNIDSKISKLLERIRRNESDLRGYSEDVYDNSGSIVESGIGLLDAIAVAIDTIVIGLDRRYIYLGESDKYVDVRKSEMHINSLIENEFELSRRLDNNTPHLILYFNE